MSSYLKQKTKKPEPPPDESLDDLFAAPPPPRITARPTSTTITATCWACEASIVIAPTADALCETCAGGGWRRALELRQKWLTTEFDAALHPYDQALALADDEISSKITRATTDLNRATDELDRANRAAYRDMTHDEIMAIIEQKQKALKTVHKRISASCKAYPQFDAVWQAYEAWRASYTALRAKEVKLAQDKLLCESLFGKKD